MRPIILACACLLACGGMGNSGGGTGSAGGGADAGTGTGGADAGSSAPVKFALQVTVNGQGSVSSMPAGIDCGNACSAAFDSGASVLLTPHPAAGFRLDGWGGACTGPGACNVMISADTQVFVTFVAIPPQQHALTVTRTGTGTGNVASQPSGIDCGNSCSASFDAGSSVMLTATAAPGSVFASWAGACSGSSTCSVTMSADSQVSARFDPQAPPPALAFTVVEIPGVEGVGELAPTSINRGGDVVGSYSLSLSTAHAFLYDAALKTTSRIAADSSDVQGASGINSSRQVSISTLKSPPVQQLGFLWQNGVETNIGALPPGPNGPDTNAIAINENGWITGWSLNAGNWERAVLWDGTSLHDLGSLGGTFSVGNAVNASGVVAGMTNTADGSGHAAVFSGGKILDLGSLGPSGSTASGINDAGRVVGFTSVPGGGVHAFVFDLPDGPMRDVSPLGICRLHGVNAPGDAVGSCATAPRVDHAVLWHGGALIDLNDAISDPSWSLFNAVAINAAGQIAGTGMHNGLARAFVLTPR